MRAPAIKASRASAWTPCVSNSVLSDRKMKFELYKDAVLTCDVPEHWLKRGDIVKLVDHHVARGGSEGYSIEVFNAVGKTSLSPPFPKPLSNLCANEILCA